MKSACIHLLKNECNDNAFIIIEQNKSLFNEMYENTKYSKIKNLTDENKRKAKKKKKNDFIINF